MWYYFRGGIFVELNKQTATQLKDLLTVCLAKAIDNALTAQFGDSWFEYFIQQDQAKEDSKTQITRKGQTSIKDFDTQALLKFLRYSTDWSNYVFLYYGVYHSDDPFANQSQGRQMRSLLDRLITDFRNQIEAHHRAADIELELENKHIERIYGYKEAAQDMIKLASLFKTVGDRNGVSYYDKMCDLYEPKKKKVTFSPLWVFGAMAIAIGVFVFMVLSNYISKEKTPPTEGNVYYNEDNNSIENGVVAIKAKHMYYDGDELVAICYITNGTNESIYNISLDRLSVYSDSKSLIAEASFVLDDINIKAGKYEEYTLRFPAHTVKNFYASLNNISLEQDGSYK